MHMTAGSLTHEKKVFWSYIMELFAFEYQKFTDY